MADNFVVGTTALSVPSSPAREATIYNAGPGDLFVGKSPTTSAASYDYRVAVNDPLTVTYNCFVASETSSRVIVNYTPEITTDMATQSELDLVSGANVAAVLAGIEEDISVLQDDVADLQTTTTATSAAVSGALTRLTALENRATAIEAINSRQTTDITSLTTRVSTLEGGTTTPPVPPETTITSAPQGTTTSTTATFTFQSSPTAGATFQVSVDGAAYVATGGGGTATTYTTGTLSAGQHTFAVKATVGGNTDATPATETWNIVASTAPDTSITAGPGVTESSTTSSTTPTFYYASTPASGTTGQATFQVSVDTGTPSWGTPSFGATSTKHTCTTLSQGNYTFRVKATVDSQTDASPATQAFAVVTAHNWAWDAANATVMTADPVNGLSSATMIASWLTYGVLNSGLSVGTYAVPTTTVANDANSVSASLSNGNATTQYLDSPLRIPYGARPASGTDRHLVITDTSQTPYRIHELYQANFDTAANRIISVGSGCSYSLDGSGYYPRAAAKNGQQSGTGNSYTACAAGVPMAAGAITPAEMQAGAINKTIHFACPKIGGPQGTTGAVWPATFNAVWPVGSDDRTVIREGMWLRLNPSTNISGLPQWEQVIAQAMKTYGMILRDHGGSTSIYGVNTQNWDLTGQAGTTSDWVTALAAQGKTITAAQGAGSATSSIAFSSTFTALFSNMQILDPPAHAAGT